MHRITDTWASISQNTEAVATVCKHEGKSTPLSTSAKLKPAFSHPTHYATGSFQSHQQSMEENTLFCALSIASI